ncbi:hypothetical protein QJ857_gp0614 [Tupanvirus soda lake]|uniref:Minor capsid protein P9 transmembrane helices domain-containing protein n=2 Tax=Tupanvirus TaxID=2094720 RepID=A0A6N1NLL7_9VIRU|nr:hypothetical protein QJ857_gp0614 [Tupanvirus soda lake]QKU35429.1 hypothetical protein [Tupanvirus soda lake]
MTDNINYNTIQTDDYQKSKNVFWLEDPTILFRDGNYYRIFPTSGMTKIQMLNSLTLFFLYLTILFLLFCDNSEYIYIPIIAIIIIIFLYFIQKNDHNETSKEYFNKNTEDIFNKKLQNETKKRYCQKPTRDNPFMNITLADLMDDPERDSACIEPKDINKEMINKYNDKIFNDINDVYERGHAQRQFYTMPVTSIPNDQTAFAKWLYEAPETCKENSINCLRHEDIRFSRYNPIIDKIGKFDTP